MTWLLFIALAVVGTAIIVTWKPADEEVEADPVALYKVQLGDIESDLKSGKLSETEAASAQLEIERRILRAAKSERLGARRATRFAGPVAGLLVIALGSALYSQLGHPNLPSSTGNRLRMLDLPIENGGATFGEAMAIIEARIAENPDDSEAHLMLANTARIIGDAGTAARAFQEMLRLDPDNRNIWEKLVFAYQGLSGNKITPSMALVVSQFRERFPGDPTAEFFTAQKYSQDGDKESAIEILQALYDNSKPSDPWTGDVTHALAKLGAPVEGYAPPETTVSLESLQIQSIRQMVNGLANRLENEPKDVEGWFRLAHSYTVLGDRDAAQKALKDGMAANPQEAERFQSALDSLTQAGNP